MLKDIRHFIDDNLEHQQQLENSWGHIIETNKQASLNAFKQTMPNIYHTLKSENNYPESVFVNKYGELDIVDVTTGKVLYGYDINKSIELHLQQFVSKPRVVSFSASSIADHLPKNIEVMVVFGVGLGAHLLSLLQEYTIAHLVVYEPNLGYLDCSLSSGIWEQVFELAAMKKTGIYLQTQLEPSRILSDFGELYEFSPFKHVYVYQHYHSDPFDNTIAYLSTATLNELGSMLRRPLLKRTHVDCLVPWPPVTSAKKWSEENLDEKLYQKNIDVFSQFFPDIASEFRHYKANKWKPLANAMGEVNIFHIETHSALYGDSPVDMEHEAYNAFVKTPTKERLALTSKQGKSYSHSHQRMVKKIEKLFAGLSAQEERLPDNVRALLLFGIGAGYKFQELYTNFDIDTLFICEPNRDFFYASLFAIDWGTILTKADESNKRVYLNIGDDGSNLARDLSTQLHVIGTHIIESMYFSQGYDNDKLKPAINNLHEELRGIIALGEYFDYSRYGVAHTKWAIEQGVSFYTASPDTSIDSTSANVPVFIVGNGPSLDNLIPLIKEERSRAIVISCGTALQVLYKNQITPDFHAEIECNRATFDWAVRIGDRQFLKSIDFISCNGAHPDTINLFKNAYLCFKEGEASTVVIQKLFPDLTIPELKFSYPTVSNFAVNFSLEMGFTQVYLLGVDLGFVDPKHHHSKLSGYYRDDGSELYDYAQKTNAGLTVKGNFRASVSTKFEFNMARTLLENAIRAFPQADVYNLNDGAAISGCLPLKPDFVIVQNSVEDKEKALVWLKLDAHKPFPRLAFTTKFDNQFDHQLMLGELEELKSLSQASINSKNDIQKVIEKQRAFIVNSFLRDSSLLFFYFNGSVNYINGVLSKLLALRDDTVTAELFSNVIKEWQLFLSDCLDSLCKVPYAFDHISSFVPERETVFMKEQSQRFIAQSKLNEADNESIKLYLDSVNKIDKKWFETNVSDSEMALLCNERNYCSEEDKHRTHVIVQVDESTTQQTLTGYLNKKNTVIYHHPVFDFRRDVDAYLNGETVFYHAINKASWTVKAWIQRNTALVIIPKLYFVGEHKEISDSLRVYAEQVLSMFPDDFRYIDYPNYIMVPKDRAQYYDYIVDKLGNRGVVCVGKPKVESLFFDGVSIREAGQQIENNILWWGFERE
jgi:hypothetical protein